MRRGSFALLSGLALLAAGLVLLDVPLLLRHETARGWITNVTYAYRGGKKSWSVYYAYLDLNRVSYSRSTFRIGHEKSGDTFPVLYDPKDPGRHRILTLSGLIPSLGLIGLGLGLGIWGWREVRGAYLLWREGRRRSGLARKEADLEAAWGRAAADAVGEVARKSGLEGVHAFAGGDLSVWLVFRTNADFERAVATGQAKRMEGDVRGALRRRGFPAADRVSVGFRTREGYDGSQPRRDP